MPRKRRFGSRGTDLRTNGRRSARMDRGQSAACVKGGVAPESAAVPGGCSRPQFSISVFDCSSRRRIPEAVPDLSSWLRIPEAALGGSSRRQISEADPGPPSVSERAKKESRGRVTQLFSSLEITRNEEKSCRALFYGGADSAPDGIDVRPCSASRYPYFLLKKFIVMAHPCVANERMASTKTFSRSGMAVRSSSVHWPRT